MLSASHTTKKSRQSPRQVFKSISRTLSPAKHQLSNSTKRISNAPSQLPPTPPLSPSRAHKPSVTSALSGSDEDDFVDVQLTETEKQYVRQCEPLQVDEENEIGAYFTDLSRQQIASDPTDRLSAAHLSSNQLDDPSSRMTKPRLLRNTKEWQEFFKIGKNDFERERRPPANESHSLGNNTAHHHRPSVSALSINPAPSDAGSGAYLSNSTNNLAPIKRVKSDQINSVPPTSRPMTAVPELLTSSTQPSPRPIRPVSVPDHTALEQVPRQAGPDQTSLHETQLEEEAHRLLLARDQARRDVEQELGLTAEVAQAIDQLTTDIDNAHLAEPIAFDKIPSTIVHPEPPRSQTARSSYAESVTSSGAATTIAPPSQSQTLDSGGREQLTDDQGKQLPRHPTSHSLSSSLRHRHKVTVEDFDIIRVLGKGCAGKVLMVKYRKSLGSKSSRVYAMKSIKKNHVLAHRELQHTLTEQSVLRRVADQPDSNPFIVRLWWSFHDKDHLFLVMDFHPGGDLATQLARWGRLGRDRARFYAAEITEGVSALHRSGVIYRDLKPENILIAFDGHIVLTDFGLSKQFGGKRDSHFDPHTILASGDRETSVEEEQDERTMTFCGTAEYLAPEVLLGEPYSYEVDWWSFGTMLFEMLSGLTPFWSEDHATMYRRVLHDELVFNEDSNRVMDNDTKTLLRGLLQRNPSVRMTGERIKKHPYFGMIDWDQLSVSLKNIDAPLVILMEPTYVQDDDPNLPATGAEDEVEQQGSNDHHQGAQDDPEESEGKISPQKAVDENGRDVFDGYSYLAPRDDRDSIIEEDEDEVEPDGTISSGNSATEKLSENPATAHHTRHNRASMLEDLDEDPHTTLNPEELGPAALSQLTSPQKQSGSSPIDKTTTKCRSDQVSSVETESHVDPLGDEDGRGTDEVEEGWDVVDAPQNGQSDTNGRGGKKTNNTLFARGVVDKYKLRMRKLNEGPSILGGVNGSTPTIGPTPHAHQSLVTPFGSSRSSMLPIAFSEGGYQPSSLSVTQQASDCSEQGNETSAGRNVGGAARKRFMLRNKKKSEKERNGNSAGGKIIGSTFFSAKNRTLSQVGGENENSKKKLKLNGLLHRQVTGSGSGPRRSEEELLN